MRDAEYTLRLMNGAKIEPEYEEYMKLEFINAIASVPENFFDSMLEAYDKSIAEQCDLLKKRFPTPISDEAGFVNAYNECGFAIHKLHKELENNAYEGQKPWYAEYLALAVDKMHLYGSNLITDETQCFDQMTVSKETFPANDWTEWCNRLEAILLYTHNAYINKDMSKFINGISSAEIYSIMQTPDLE